MRKLLALVVILLASLTSYAHAFEPSEGLQWNQEERLGGKMALRYNLLSINGEPAQLTHSRKGDIPALTQFDIALQYRIFENQTWLWFECSSEVSFVTHWDVPDRVNMMFECGNTFWKDYRLEVGYLKMLNIGIPSGGRGISAYWLGGSVKLLENEDFLLDGYARYYLESGIPARIEDIYQKSADQAVGELGLRADYKIWKFVSLFAAPYVVFDSSLEPSRFGTYGGLRYDLGDHLNFRPNVSLEVAGNYGINANFDGDATMVWVKLIWWLK